MDLKQKLKSLIGSSRQDSSLLSPTEESASDILTVGAAITKPKIDKRPVNPHEEQEIIDGIEEFYYHGSDFNTSLAELEKLTDEIDPDLISDDCARLKRQLTAVTKRVSELILQNHPAYAAELQRVMDLQRTLLAAGKVCHNGRRELSRARESFTIASLGLLSNYRKRQQLIGLLKSLRTIKTLQRTDLRLREMMEEEDYSGAIQLCLECQQAASTFKHYKCISELSSKLQDTLETIEEQLDTALAKTCRRFDETHYAKVQMAYRCLGKTQTAMDQLHMHFASAIHNTAFTIVLGYVELASGSGGQANFQKRQYPDLCKHITIETFTPCLVDLCRALWEVMRSYYQTIQWHEDNDKEGPAGQHTPNEDASSEVEANFSRRYVWEKLEYGRGRVWQDVQQKVKAFFSSCDLSAFKLDEFIFVLDIVNRLIEIGEEFCGSKSEGLQESLKQQSLLYFKAHHHTCLDELRMFLENEAWEMCPVRANFNIMHLTEFRFLRKWANSQQGMAGAETKGDKYEEPDGEGKSYFQTYLQEGSPFDKPPEDDDDENEDVFSADGAEEGYADSDSDQDIPDELKKDYVDEIPGETPAQGGLRRSSSRSHHHHRPKQGSPLITNTTLNVLRVMGKYLQMISILKPIAFEVITCISQLYDYYFYTVYSFFATETPPGSDRSVPSRLYSSLQRIQDNLIHHHHHQPSPSPSSFQSAASEAPHHQVASKIPAAQMSPVVSLQHASTLYGLAERVVATESLMFLSGQLEWLHSYLEELIPFNKKTFLAQFFSQTVSMAAQIRKPVYGKLSRSCVGYEAVLQQMAGVKWDIRDIMSQHNPYVDTLLVSFKEFQKRLQEVDKRVPLPKPVCDLVWQQCVGQANLTFVEGYSIAKKCSTEGRALMQLDFQQFLTNLDQIVELRPVPEREFVEAYIKAYYLPESQLEKWIGEHKEYSNKQLLALITCADHLSRKTRQRLSALVEEMDRGRR